MSDDAPPIWMIYNGTGFDIKPGHSQKKADEHYIIGEQYRMLAENERSAKSHKHYFASVREAHKNLPDELLELHPSPTALRKHALIRTGWCDQITYVCSSEADARRQVSFWAPMHPEAIILSKRNVLIMYTAKSQRLKAMGAKDFQRSKDDVLTWIAAQIGTTKKALEDNAGASEGGQR